MSELSIPKADLVEDDVSDILRRCDELSAFRLFRLNAAIGQMLDDPDRIQQVRKVIQAGDEIEYFDPTRNRCVRAIVPKCKRTRLSATDLEDGKGWSIFYSSVNVNDEDILHARASGPSMTRSEAAVGELVGFVDRQNCERIGTVEKLNPNTAGVECEDGTNCQVAYKLLFRVFDGDDRERRNALQLP